MVNEITIIDMSKPRNKNISNIDKYFLNKLNDLKERIDVKESDIKSFKKFMLGSWFDAFKKIKGDSYKEEWHLEQINKLLGILKGDKQYRIELINEYCELKKMHKTLHRALEERWMDGFAEGVRFVLSSYDTEEECE